MLEVRKDVGPPVIPPKDTVATHREFIGRLQGAGGFKFSVHIFRSRSKEASKIAEVQLFRGCPFWCESCGLI